MKRIGGFQFVAGFVLGAAMFGGFAAFAADITAQPKTAAVVIDGQEVDLKGYVIEDAHYFQLRDLAAALKPGGKDFSVVWDGADNQIVIDTSSGYDPNETFPAAVPASAPAQNEEPATAIDEMKMEIVRLTNEERVKAGAPELEVLPELMDCAQAKADDMGKNHYFGHDSPVYGTPGEMIRSFVPDTKSCGENLLALSAWTGTLQEAFEGWVDSPDHLRNMVNPKHTHIGVGIIIDADGKQKWVQQFVAL